MDMRTAAAQTKVINLSSNISALVTFILTGNVYYTLGAAVFRLFGSRPLSGSRTGGP